MRKPTFCICENKGADQLCGNGKVDQRLCFYYIVQFLYFLNPKFQDCVGGGRKPERLFSHDVAQLGTSFVICGQFLFFFFKKKEM